MQFCFQYSGQQCAHPGAQQAEDSPWARLQSGRSRVCAWGNSGGSLSPAISNRQELGLYVLKHMEREGSVQWLQEMW